MISKNIDTIDDKGRFVAIKLGLPEHTVCEFPANWQTHQGDDADWCEHGRRFPHRDYPDFLSPAGADLLLRSLLKQHECRFDVAGTDEFDDPPELPAVTFVCRIPLVTGWLSGYGPDWKAALLDAAYNLLKALEEK